MFYFFCIPIAFTVATMLFTFADLDASLVAVEVSVFGPPIAMAIFPPPAKVGILKICAKVVKVTVVVSPTLRLKFAVAGFVK